MTSRQRILAAVDHKEPDRIPIDLNGQRSSGIMAKAYVRLREHLGLPPSRLYVYDFIQQLPLVEDDAPDLVFAQDHGDCLAAHRFFQKFVAYEESAHVSLFITPPGGRTPGRRS